MKRRLVALLIIAVFFFIVILALNNSMKARKAKLSKEKTDPLATNPLREKLADNMIEDSMRLVRAKFFKTSFADGDIVAQPSRQLLVHRQNILKAQSMGKIGKQALLNKEAYLTFDDGPSDITVKILDILKHYNIKATFFVIGRNVRARPEVLKRIAAEGHDIGIHTQTHEYKQLYASEEALRQDILACLESIRSVLGPKFDTNLYRFPGGSFNREKYIPLVEDMGLVYFDWNVLNGDAEGNGLDESYLIDRFVETSKGYNKQIILMHDSETKQITANTLPAIIEMLKEDGFRFKTLGDI